MIMKKLKVLHRLKIKLKCKHCAIVLGANSRHGTSHLKRHLDRCPKKMHHDIKQYMLSADTSADGSTILTKYKYDEVQSRKLMLTYLVEDLRPFETVEKRGCLLYTSPSPRD